jgi:hypothetical protein
MPNKKHKMPPMRSDADLAFRKAIINTQEADDTKRSVPVVLATENPVQVWDESRRMMIDEYLDMDGVELPSQVPFVDSHKHDTVRSVLGSVRELAIVNRELHGRTFFATKPAAVESYQDIRDGHLTDISVGARRIQQTFVESGRSVEWKGRKIQGPARIVTRWRPFEGSAVTVGADSRSVFGQSAMRAYFDPTGAKEDDMAATFRSVLEKLGMPEDTSEENVVTWAADNLSKRQAAVETPAAAPAPVAPALPDVVTRSAVSETKSPPVDVVALRKQAADDERQRINTIRSLAGAAGVDSKTADELVSSGADYATIARRIQDEQAARREPVGIKPIGSEHESFRAAVLDGFAQRLNWRPTATDKVAPGANVFRSMRFLDLMRKSLEFEGVNIRNLNDRDLIARAFAGGDGISLRGSDGQAWHTTGNFANLLLDASNKTLLNAYNEARVTWSRWARNAGTTPDLKAINRIRLGEVGNLPMVPENDDYKDLAISDAKESYKPLKHGAIVSLTWETMINDDLNAFARLVQLQGNSAARTVDKAVYQLFFDNPTMSDTGALFNSTAVTTAGGHNNLVASDLSVATLDAAYEDFMLQPGINSDVLLGLMPRYLMVAPGIAGTAWQLVNSIADPTASGNSGVANIYGPGGARRLEVIEVPWLTANDADSWYLAADHNEIDTVEVTFLEGEQTPAFEQESAFRQDAVLYKVRQTFGVAAIDWRGLFKSTGSG